MLTLSPTIKHLNNFFVKTLVDFKQYLLATGPNSDALLQQLQAIIIGVESGIAAPGFLPAL